MKRFGFATGAVVAGVGVAALLLGLPGAKANGDVVAVKASDYAFSGVPKSLSAGETRISFTNESQSEGHQMDVFRINDGVKDTFDQILAEDEARQQQAAQAAQPAPDGQQQPQAEPAAPPPPKMSFFASTGAGPGESARMDLIGNLPAGRYGLVCFLPVADDQAGTPHYKKGMKAEFTVQ